ncbi:MAG TPA: urate oxidase [Vicinamibacterales bacterium]|jgi:urate oxidase
MPVLGANRYGKSRIRLVKVRRHAAGSADAPHELLDLTIDILLEGAFEAVYADGDNAACVATDTMKNTVYAFARRNEIAHVETFALSLASHFVEQPAVSAATVAAIEHRWERLSAHGRRHPHAFVQPGGEQWTTKVTRDAAGTRVSSGLTNLVVLKTSDSAFAGFPRDAYTTLPETTDRILATAVTAVWAYRSEAADFGARERIRTALVERFAAHDSRSVQHTLYAMGEAALAASSDISEISLSMPNRHHLLVDLQPFGLDNPNEIFVATDQPFGLIEATVRR